MATTNSLARVQVAQSNRNEATQILKQIRNENTREQKLQLSVAASNAAKNQQEREIVRLNSLIEQENASHERRIKDLQTALDTIKTNKFYSDQRIGWNKTESKIVKSNKAVLKEKITGIHARQTQQNKLKTSAWKYALNFEKAARKKPKARSTGSLKVKTSMNRRSL